MIPVWLQNSIRQVLADSKGDKDVKADVKELEKEGKLAKETPKPVETIVETVVAPETVAAKTEVKADLVKVEEPKVAVVEPAVVVAVDADKTKVDRKEKIKQIVLKAREKKETQIKVKNILAKVESRERIARIKARIAKKKEEIGEEVGKEKKPFNKADMFKKKEDKGAGKEAVAETGKEVGEGKAKKTINKDEIIKKLRTRRKIKMFLTRKAIQAKKEAEAKKQPLISKEKKDAILKRIKAKRQTRAIIADMKTRLGLKKIVSEDLPGKVEVDFLTRKSPKVTEEQVMNAPTTKSKQLIEMVSNLRDIVEVRDLKLDAVKEYCKEVKLELEESLQTEKHKTESIKGVKEVLAKNNDLITKANEITRLDNENVMWIEKIMVDVPKFDKEKLGEPEKAKYDILKAEIEAKTKEAKALEALATTIEKKTSEIRLVIMKTKPVVSNIQAISDMVAVLEMYDEAIEIADSMIVKINSFLGSVAQWFKGLFGK
jgi:hypothetical protein